MKLFTIGHSNHSLGRFIRLLEDNGIMVLVDVRTGLCRLRAGHPKGL